MGTGVAEQPGTNPPGIALLTRWGETHPMPGVKAEEHKKKDFPLFSAPQNNKTPWVHPTKDLTLKVLFLLPPWGKHPQLPPGTS